MAVRNGMNAKPASRLRLRLAASVLVAAPIVAAAIAPHAVNAESTLIIDSGGARVVEQFGRLGASSFLGGEADGAVTLDFSVLDGFGDGQPGPIQLRRPTGLLADASAKTAPIRLKPPSLMQGRPGRLQPNRHRLQFAFRPPLPPRRPMVDNPIVARPMIERAISAPELAAAPPLPPRRPTAMAPSELAAAAPPPMPAPRPTATDLPPPPPAADIAPILLAPIAPQPSRSPAPAPRALGAMPAFLPTQEPLTAADTLAAAPRRAEPPVPAPEGPGDTGLALQVRVREIDPSAGVSEELHQRIMAYNVEHAPPPEMAKPGWRNPAPQAISIATQPVAELPDLASIAPAHLMDDLPAPNAGPAAPALPVVAAMEIAQPGDAVLAPPPPPARVAEIIARPETARAIPEPEQEAAPPPRRRPLSVPASLAKVMAPTTGEAGPPRALVAERRRDADLRAAPDFAVLPLPRPQDYGRETAATDTDRDGALNSLAATQSPAAPVSRPAPRPPVQLALALDGALPTGRAVNPAADAATEIAFAAASRSLPTAAEPALRRIVAQLKAHPDLTVTLSGGAAASAPKRARELALARAVAVHRYLVSRGVEHRTITVEPVTSASAKDAVSVKLVSPA